MKNLYTCLIGIVLYTVTATTVIAQVTIGPTMLFFKHGQTSETLTLVNPSTDDKQVSIETRFAYPSADTTGSVRMVDGDSAKAMSFDATPHVSFYPRRFILKGGTTQNVRFRVRVADVTKPGLHWTRVIVTSSLAQDAPERMTGSEAQMQFECAQNFPLFVVHQLPEVQLLPRVLSAWQDSIGQSHLAVDTGPIGNAPFIGSLGIVISRQGRVILNHTIPVSLYVQERTQLLPKNVILDNGLYEARLYWTLGRDNVLPQFAPTYQPISEQFSFAVEGRVILHAR